MTMTFYPIINGMDPQNQYIMYRLLRDATRFKNGTHTKDLYSVNRDLKKVIVIVWNEKTTADTPENSLVMSNYKQFDDPMEVFRENQRKLEEIMRLEEERK